LKVGYFATAGHTEVGGLHRFLQKLGPDITWERRFPAVEKPGPKRGGSTPIPRRSQSGITGAALLREVRRGLRAHPTCDAYVIVDDGDCRAQARDPEALQALEAELSSAVEGRTRVVVIYMEPEVEAWLLADWGNGFGRWAGEREPIAAGASKVVLGAAWDHLEDFGGPEKAEGGCTRKLSSELAEALVTAGLPRYSKRRDGALMLGRVDPRAVARRAGPRTRVAFGRLRTLGELP